MMEKLASYFILEQLLYILNMLLREHWIVSSC